MTRRHLDQVFLQSFSCMHNYPPKKTMPVFFCLFFFPLLRMSLSRLSRRLCSLDYPGWREFDPESPADFHALVYWLEDNMIQSYELEERRQLLENYVSGAHWQDRMSAYLERLGGPSGTDSRAVEWLADHALELDFADNRALYLTESSRLLQKSLFERAVADPAERARFDAAVRQVALHMGF